MDKFDRSLARIARNIMSAADSIETTEVKLALYMVAAEIGAEAMRPDEVAEVPLAADPLHFAHISGGLK